MRPSFLKVVTGVLMLATTSAFAQENIDTAIFNKIKTAELQSSHIPQIAHYLTDVAGPRLTGSQGFMTAANWVVATMKSWGMQNAALESWGDFGKQWELNDFNMFYARHTRSP